MSAPAVDLSDRSAECALAARDGYKDLHRSCRQTKDVPLPHHRDILLVKRCTCWCHRYSKCPPGLA
ncbi:hypothetical protein ABT187_44425 [Streptomyces sp. NPDC001817]|uniref:hypothetical protein n=1 Tax=Streptomyces sp. NPDC001817 TaxID=3154398 RepID=UPI003319A71E